MTNTNIYFSLVISVIAQVVTGIIEVSSLLIKVNSQYLFLKQLMILEVFVQIIEAGFYLYWFNNFKKINNVTPTRYYDWVITTPTMLLNLVFYLIFLKHKQENTSDKLNFFKLFKQESSTLIVIFVLNWLMLLFGYLAEMKKISTALGVMLGFIPFFIYYFIIYDKYALLTKDGFIIYSYFLFFWSLYGLAALMPYNIKNIIYNMLDLFSKNFFGIFLGYLIYKNKS